MPPAPTFDTTCTQPATPGLQTYLDSLPAGSTFTSSSTACYLVPTGILLTKSIKIVGGTFFDPTNALGTVPGQMTPKPIILIKDTSFVSVSDVSVLGVNTDGSYHPHLVNQSGIELKSATDVTLTNITSKNTFGDGLELVEDMTHVPVTRLQVEGYTIIGAGRQAVTLAEVSHSVLDHVNIVSSADAGFDFESDIPWLGSDTVTISNCTNNRGFNMIEPLTGPITVTNCTGSHRINLNGPHATAQVSFTGGTMVCRRRDPVPCIRLSGGAMTLTGITMTREAGLWAPTTPIWAVSNAGKLSFVHCSIAFPMGWTADTSAMSFIP